ncbi:MAG TPA: hypothetical protein VIV15_16945, partial [Anaerolineales bacterium]
SAFLDLLNAYAIWFYIVGIVGILLGIKMLVDSRRQARTTLFTLEQEQANDRAFRAIFIMMGFTVLIVGVSAINTLVVPVRPTPQAATLAQPTTLPYTPPVVLPTFTTVPTLTPQGPPTVAPTQITTRNISSTNTPVPVEPTQPPVQVQPTAPKPTAPPAVGYPAPVLVAPVDKSANSAARIQFVWGRGEVPSHLPDGQSYLITVSYTDRDSKQQIVRTNCTQDNTIWTTNWIGDDQNRAVDLYSWSVILVQLPSPGARCEQGTPVSPRSETHTFTWH